MRTYHISGGTPLCGEVYISGAKNAVLPILAASLVCKSPTLLSNCPDISDVDNAVAILNDLGCITERRADRIYIDPTHAGGFMIKPCFMEKMRATVIFLGALLATFGKAQISQPGGCRLGQRPIDLHLMGLERMGYRCIRCGEKLYFTEEKLCGCTIALPFASVGATENLILAALRCPEEVVICNAAKEPEIGDLIAYLRRCGACITGENTSVVRVVGGKKLKGAVHTVMPDRMEAATFLCAAATTRGELLLKNVCPKHFEAVTNLLHKAGCQIRVCANEMHICCSRLDAVSPIRTAPYDGFPTDAQAPVMAAMATAKGVSVFEETIFSDRFRHVPALCKLGANIRAVGRCAIVNGTKELHGANVSATDLRGGAAMVLAALAAQGESNVANVYHIERGYEHFSRKLNLCGAQIKITE